MGNLTQTFEAKVEVKKKGSRHFSSLVGMYIENKITKMFHVDARTPEQAMRKVEKYGRLLSVRKVDTEKMRGNIEMCLMRDKVENPYPNAVAMDEFVWKRKGKRDERIESRERDKDGY